VADFAAAVAGSLAVIAAAVVVRSVS